MKRPHSYFLLLVLVSCLSSCIKEPRPGAESKQQKVQAAVDKVRSDLVDSLGMPVPSLNVLIQTPREKIFVSSFLETGKRVTKDTYFRFASNTKNFTSAAILNMYEDGWLDYKAKITASIPGSKRSYVPASADWEFPYKEQVTIEQLLQHSAGVFDVDNDPVPGYNGLSYTEFTQENDPDHQFSPDEMVKVLKQKNLYYFIPGTAHHYSNTGYSILSKIIQRVYSYKAGTQKTYADYLNDYLVGKFATIPLHRVHFPILAKDDRLPEPHVVGTIYGAGGIEIYNNYNMSGQVGEGNGYGTMDDLNTYIRSLMKGKNVLKPSTVQLMQTSISPGDTRYALGCSFTPNIGYGHNGARIGYLSLMAYDPVYDVSVISMIPLWDLREGFSSFLKTYNAIQDAAYAARKALGYPGKP